MTATYRDKLQFDAIVILESLPTRPKTGAELYDNVLKPWAEHDPGFLLSYNPIDSRDHFFNGFDAIEEQVVGQHRIPIVHIEAHGTQEGITLANGDLVLWEELRDHLTRINVKSQFNLLVVMAMCSGWWITRPLAPLRARRQAEAPLAA